MSFVPMPVVELPFSVSGTTPSYYVTATRDLVFSVQAVAAALTPTSTRDLPFKVSGNAALYTVEATRDLVFSVQAEDSTFSFEPDDEADMAFSISGTYTYLGPDDTSDLCFTITGVTSDYSIKPSRDTIFTVNGSPSGATPITGDLPFKVIGDFPYFASETHDYCFTVSGISMLMSLGNLLAALEVDGNASADLTLNSLVLGNTQDYGTKWYNYTYTQSTIKGSIQPRGVVMDKLPIGATAQYDLTLFTENNVFVDDQVTDALMQIYTVKTKEDYWYLNRFSHYQCGLEKLTPHNQHPSTSGAWTGGEYTQYNTLTQLDANLTAASLTKDDNTTPAAFITTLGKAEYDVTHIFYEKNVDLIFCVGQPSVDANNEYEDVPIDIYTVNKTGITAIKLREKAEKELTRIIATAPFGLTRGFTRKTPDSNIDEKISHAAYNIAVYKNTAVTKRALTLEEPYDAITGWPSKLYSVYASNMLIRRKGNTVVLNNLFHAVVYTVTGFSLESMNLGDEVTTSDGSIYIVQSCEKQTFFGAVSSYVSELVQRDAATSPNTSGFWYMDGGVVSDSRYRHKEWIDTYRPLIATPATLDDGATLSNLRVCFADSNLPMLPLFHVLDVDGVYVIDKAEAKNLYTQDHYLYGYEEQVPITCYAMDKIDVTATNQLDKMVHEINQIATAYPTSTYSIRSIDVVKNPAPQKVGGAQVWSTIVTVKYFRANEDYLPTVPKITYATALGGPYTFVFPNVTRLSPPIKTDDAWLHPPGFSGTLNQAQGSGPIEIELECDLNICPPSVQWRRDMDKTQDATGIYDGNPFDVFLELIHEQGIGQPYCILDTGTLTFNARLISMTPSYTGDQRRVTLLFREYRADSASDETAAARFGSV